MKKQTFNLFYSLAVNKITRGGGSSAPSSTPSTEPSAAPESNEDASKATNKDRKDVLDYIDLQSAVIQRKSMDVHGVFKDKEGGSDTMITLELTKGYKNTIKKLETLKSSAVKVLYKLQTKAEINAFVIKVKQKLEAIEQEIELLNNKMKLQKKLKEIAKKTIQEHISNWEKDTPKGIKEAATKTEILVIATGYIGRWYKVNALALSKLNNLESTIINLENFNSKPPAGELFSDLETLNKEINEEVYEKWITGMAHKDVLRTVFSKLGWEDKFLKDIKDKDLKELVKQFNDRNPKNKGGYRNYGEIIDDLLNYIQKNAVPGNLPDFPGRTDAIKAAGIEAGIVTDTPSATPSEAPKPAPTPKTPEALKAAEQREKYVKQYRTAHEAEIKKIDGLTAKPINDPKYPDSVAYQIFKDGKPFDRTYFRLKDKQMAYGLSHTRWINMPSPNMCAEGNAKLLKNKLEELAMKNAPKLLGMKVVKGNLQVSVEKGKGIPNPYPVKLPKAIKKYVSTKVKYSASSVEGIVYKENDINKQLVENILASVPKGPIRDQLEKSLNNPTTGAPVVKELLKIGPKQKLRVIGRASFDGNFGGNKALALKRANDAKAKIQKQVGKNVELIAVGEVAGPDGKKIERNGVNNAYTLMAKMWNKEFYNLPNGTTKEIKSAEMKKIVKDYINGKTKGLKPKQVAFLKRTLNDQRGVQVEVLAPKKPAQFNINFVPSAPAAVATTSAAPTTPA